MRSVAFVLALVVLAGCATTTGKPWNGAQADADRDYCHDQAKDKEPSTAEKVAVYASNILIVPISTALTLGFGTVYAYPKTGYEAQRAYFDQCMVRLGYRL